jgi:hypothetical protein
VKIVIDNIMTKKYFILFLFLTSLFFCLLGLIHCISQYSRLLSQILWQPQLVCNETNYNVGQLTVPEKGKHEFGLQNTGSQNLVIEKVAPGCGACVEVTNFTKTPIPPGQSGTVTLTLLTQHLKGKVQKEALVKTNDPKNPNLILTLEAEVIRPETENTTKNIQEPNTGTSTQSVSAIP